MQVSNCVTLRWNLIVEKNINITPHTHIKIPIPNYWHIKFQYSCIGSVVKNSMRLCLNISMKWNASTHKHFPAHSCQVTIQTAIIGVI